MSTKGGRIGRHLFHGDPNRFQIIADYVFENYKGKIKTIADVAGGQGMLTRILRKKYNFDAEVVDTREYVLTGVKHCQEEYSSKMANYYDLIIGIHPDQATRAIAESACVKPTILIPCCNFWDKDKKLGTTALLEEIERYYKENKVVYKRFTFDFEGPKNIGLISEPPKVLK